MKKKIIALVAAIACIVLSISVVQPVTTNAVDLIETYNKLIDIYNRVFGDETNVTVNNNVNEVKEKVDSIDVDQSLEDYFSPIDRADTGLTMGALLIPQGFARITNDVWGEITSTITANDPGTDFGKYLGAVLVPDDPNYATVVAIMRTLGYALVLVFFSVNLIEQTVKFEIFTVKGMLQIFGRLILAKIIIDLSVTICMAILRACGEISSRILSNNVMTLDGFVPKVDLATSNVKVIGPLIDLLISAILCLALLIVVFALLIATSFVLIKLVLRAIELTLLVTVSPAFFACAATDTTRQYFRNFILTFIQVSAQVIFMAIVLFIGSTTLVLEGGNLEITSIPMAIQWITSIVPNAILLIAMCIMMVKPPKVLTGLLK